MKPYFTLTKEGDVIFKELHDHIKSHDLEDVDVYQITLLANAFDIFQKNSKELVTSDNTKRSSNLMQMDKAVNWIVKISPKFGISPGDREKLKAFRTKERELNTEEKHKLKLTR